MIIPKQIRVLVADDSSVARAMLRAILEEQEDIQVIAEAENGQQAVELVQLLRPDLVTMDLCMPVMNGIEAIAQIMHNKAVPILVVSSETDAELACEALYHGALDVINKPSFDEEEAEFLVERVRLLAGVPVITRIQRSKLVHKTATSLTTESSTTKPMICAAVITPLQSMSKLVGFSQSVFLNPIFAIASSTGGPKALANLLSELPANFAAPIVVAQHISNGFIEGMAQWLSSVSLLPVKVAEEGELLVAGTVYLSPSEQHLTLTPNFKVKLKQRAEQDIYHPSCDEMLASVANIYGKNAVGIIMTGMGRDGTLGMTKIYEQGGLTLAQDEASSVIYGMNGEAVKAGVIHLELPLSKLAEEMLKIVQLKPAIYLAALRRGSV